MATVKENNDPIYRSGWIDGYHQGHKEGHISAPYRPAMDYEKHPATGISLVADLEHMSRDHDMAGGRSNQQMFREAAFSIRRMATACNKAIDEMAAWDPHAALDHTTSLAFAIQTLRTALTSSAA